MNDPLTLLKKDHREVLRVLTTLEQTEQGEERSQLLAEVSTALQLHMYIEESIVYPVINELLDEEMGEEAKTEHQLASKVLEQMDSLVSEPGFGAAVAMLLGGLRHHIEEEEKEILPQLKDQLDRDEWQSMGDRIVEAKGSASSEGSGTPRQDKSSSRASRAHKQPSRRTASRSNSKTSRSSSKRQMASRV